MGFESAETNDADLGAKMRAIFDGLKKEANGGIYVPSAISDSWTFNKFVNEIDVEDAYMQRLLRLMAYVHIQ
jgi:hypothetical protein